MIIYASIVIVTFTYHALQSEKRSFSKIYQLNNSMKVTACKIFPKCQARILDVAWHSVFLNTKAFHAMGVMFSTSPAHSALFLHSFSIQKRHYVEIKVTNCEALLFL